MSSSANPSTPDQPVGISVVAPVHNEQDNIVPLTDEIVAALEPLGRSFEILFVDDASTDESPLRLAELDQRVDQLHTFRLTRQSGQSAALLAGLRRARGEVLVTLDSDRQNDPADIPALLTALDGHDLVSGVRRQRNDTALRRFASRFANRVRRWALGDPFTDSGCALKAYRAELLRDLPPFDGLHRFLPVLAYHRLDNPARATEIDVNHRARPAGSSKYAAIRGRALRGLWDLVGVRWWLARGLRAGFDDVEQDGAD